MTTEVTQGQYATVTGWNPSSYAADCDDTCPVETVSWYDTVAYANELSSQSGLSPCYTLSDIICAGGANVGTNALGCMNATQTNIDSATVSVTGGSAYACTGYRLPTESEWEYAARAGTNTAFFSGTITNVECNPIDANLDSIGWYCGNADSTPHSVAGKTPNAFGLYDMSGNVEEWVWDWYQAAYPSGTTVLPAVDPQGPSSGLSRVGRGGIWSFYAVYCRSGDRYDSHPGITKDYRGFRLVRSAP